MLASQTDEDPAGEGLWRTSEAPWGDLRVTWEGPRGSWLVMGISAVTLLCPKPAFLSFLQHLSRNLLVLQSPECLGVGVRLCWWHPEILT